MPFKTQFINFEKSYINFEGLSPLWSEDIQSFPGGSPSSSSLENPLVHYSSNGTYNISLTVTNSYGSDTTLRSFNIVISNPNVAITTLGTICPSSQGSFSAQVSNVDSVMQYKWEKNGQYVGLNSPTYSDSSLNSGDSIWVTIIALKCENGDTITSSHMAIPFSDFAPQITGSNCVDDTLTASLGSIPSMLEWMENGSDTLKLYSSYNTNGRVVAGGHGVGGNANQLNYPGGIFKDNQGNLFIADESNNRIQKWANGATTGVTVVGGANQLNIPSDVFVDKYNNIFICDGGNSRVQEWMPGATAGITVAGGNGYGPAPNQLRNPTSIFLDDSDNIYVAEAGNNRISKWTVGSSFGITVAGSASGMSGSAANLLNSPGGVSVDDSGSVYVADFNNNRIQKWGKNAITGITVAGGNGSGIGMNQFNGPTSVRLDGLGNIYVLDQNNNRVQRWSENGITGITVAGGNGAGSGLNQLAYPYGLFVDNKGDIYISDFDNFRVMEYNPIINQTFEATSPGTYNVTAVNFDGCSLSSNSITINPFVTPQITITDSSSNPCTASLDTFIAVAVNGGSSPIFSWRKNNTIIGSNYSEFVASNLNNNDSIWTILTSNAPCASESSVLSNKIIVSKTVTPVIGITSENGITVCSGTQLIFSSTIINGGSDPKYQWSENGIPVSGNLDSLHLSAPSDGDIVSCRLISNELCATPDTVISNVISLTVITSPLKPIISRSGEILTSSPSSNYQWLFNGSLIAGANLQSYTATQSGWYQVVITNDSGCTAKSDSLYVLLSGFVDIGNSTKVEILPNPFRTNFTIQMSSDLIGYSPIRFFLTDGLGRIIYEKNDVSHRNDVDLCQRAAGIYFLYIYNGSNISTFKLIKLE